MAKITHTLEVQQMEADEWNGAISDCECFLDELKTGVDVFGDKIPLHQKIFLAKCLAEDALTIMDFLKSQITEEE